MKYGWLDEYLPAKKDVRQDFKADGNISDNMLKELLDKSYSLVLGGLSRKKQAEILQQSTK